MRSIRLIAAHDEYDTTPGLIIKGTPSFDGLSADRNGLLIAHDLLEHVNGPKHMGPVWDELEALGAIWQVRGRHGEMMTETRSYHTPQVNVAADITRMFEGWLMEPQQGSTRTKAHEYDDDFRDILEIARRDIPREFNDPRPTSEQVEEYLSFALHRLRTGFRKAERKYGTHFEGANLFQAVRDAVKAVMPMVDFEGQEFILTYGDGEASCRPVENS
jgi:hypothetical protein